MTAIYTSNDAAIGFDVAGAGILPTDWTNIGSGVWSLGTTNRTNGHPLTLACTSAQDQDVALLTGVGAAADMDVYFLQKYQSNGAFISAIVRADAGWTQGYLFAFAPGSGNIFLFKRVASAFTLITNFPSFTLSSAHPIAVRMQALGTTIRVKVWDAYTAEPTGWSGSVTDSSVTAAGYAGVFNGENSGATNGNVNSFVDFAVSSLTSTAVTVDTPASQIAGASLALTGTYTGTAPTGINYAYSGGSYVAATGFSASGGTWSATAVAPPTGGLSWVEVQEANSTATTSASGSFPVMVAGGHNLALAGGITFDNSGQKFGSGAMAAGGGGGGTVPNFLLSFTSLTIELWVNDASPSGNRALFSGNTLNTVIVQQRANVLTQTELGNSLAAGPNISDGAWHHIALVYTPAGSSYYVDGTLAGSNSDVVVAVGGYTIGVGQLSGGGFNFRGDLDEVAIWNYAKYNANFTPPSSPYTGSESGLLALWHLDSDGSDSAGGGETISVTTPGAATAGSPMTVSGTYTGGPPLALDVQFDSAGWASASSPTIGGGAFSFSVNAPSAGSHTVSVRDDFNTSVVGTSGSFTSSAGGTITVTTPGTVTAGSGMTVSGTYTGADPSGLDFEFDSAGYGSASSPTIGGGAFSFSATAPSAGSHTVSVRESNATSISNTSGSFTSVSTPTIAVTTPSGLIPSGQPLAIAGTYTGAAPTGVNARVDSGGYSAATGFSASGGSWSATMTAPPPGSHTIGVQEANSTGTTATSASFSVCLAPGSSTILYSPYNWELGGSYSRSITAGAYFSLLFTGASCTLNFDVSQNLTPLSQIWWRVDGPEGVWAEAPVASTVACAAPSSTSGNADVPSHLLEVVVKSTTETQNRWNSGGGTAVVFKGVTPGSGASSTAPLGAPRRLLVFGDSITEGVRAVGESAANDTDRNDGAAGWAFRLGALLGAEVGVVGFGATGLVSAGSGNVPALTSTYNYLSSGVSRSFSPAPDLIVLHEGTNDGSSNTVSALTTVLNGLISACPGVPIAVLRPFNGTLQASNLQAGIAACSSPGSCHYIDTAGMFDTSLGADGYSLHPSGPNNLSRIAPQVAAALGPLLAGAPVSYRGGFRPA